MTQVNLTDAPSRNGLFVSHHVIGGEPNYLIKGIDYIVLTILLSFH
jgi:hypothetical protein